MIPAESDVGDHAGERRTIGRAGRGRTKVAGVIVRADAVTHILPLLWERRRRGIIGRILPQHRGSVAAYECEEVAFGVELEVRVQRPAWITAILAGGEHDERAAGGNADCRKRPLFQIRRVVGEKITAHTESERVRVLQFDPVRSVAILIFQATGIVGEEFAQIRWRQQDVHADDRGCGAAAVVVRGGEREGGRNDGSYAGHPVRRVYRADARRNGGARGIVDFPTEVRPLAGGDDILIRVEEPDHRRQASKNFDLRELRIVAGAAGVHDPNKAPREGAARIVRRRDCVRAADPGV